MPQAPRASRLPTPGSRSATSLRSMCSCSPGKGAGSRSRSAHSGRRSSARSSRRSTAGGCRRRSTSSSTPPTFPGGSTSRMSSPRHWSARTTSRPHRSPGSRRSMPPSCRANRPTSRSAATATGGRSPTTAFRARPRDSGRGTDGGRQVNCSRRVGHATSSRPCSASPTATETPSLKWCLGWRPPPRQTARGRSARSTSPSTRTCARRRAAVTSTRSSASSPALAFRGSCSRERCQ